MALMRHRYIHYLFLGLALFWKSNAFSQPDTSFHIYLMFGQSNMEGAGTIEAQDRIVNPRVWALQDLDCPNLGRSYGNWYPAAPPLNRCWSGLGPGDSFGKMLGEKAPDHVTIGLVNASVSGCNIFIYKKGCPDGLDPISQGIPFNCGYSWLLDLANKALEVGVIKGIIFHQGETNNTDPQWKYTVQQIMADLKSDLDLGDIPFLAGELLYSEFNSCCSAHNVEINKLPGIIPNAHVISATGLPGVDYAHFTSASYRTLGQRYAAKMLYLVYGICDTTLLEPRFKIGKGSYQAGDSVLVHHGTSLLLSPLPEYSPGLWNWSGPVTIGSKREQTVNTAEEGVYEAKVTYTNECGSPNELFFKVHICDSTLVESWYRIDGGEMTQNDTVRVLKGASVLLSPKESEVSGSWHWSGAGTGGNEREQNLVLSEPGIFKATAAFNNGCGAVTHLPVIIQVCDTSLIRFRYRVNSEDWIYSDTVKVQEGDQVLLSPVVDNASGIWLWNGPDLEGTSRQQFLNTDTPGMNSAQLSFTNACGYTSHLSIVLNIDPETGFEIHDRSDSYFVLYPNPARETITFYLDKYLINDQLEYNVAIINSSGQTHILFHSQGSRFTLDTRILEPGIYTVRISDEQKSASRRFMIIR